MKLTYIKTWEASGNAVFEPDMIIAKAYRTVFASYRPKHFIYYQKYNKKLLGEAYDSQEEMDKFDTSGFKDFRNKNYIKRYFSNISKAIADNEKVINIINQVDFDIISEKRISELLIRSIKSIEKNFSCFLACQPQRFIKIEKWIQSELSKFVPDSKAGEVFRILSTPTKSSPIRDEQLDWLKLIIKIKKERISLKSELFNELILNHHSKYAILGAADGKEPWSKNHYILEYKNDKRSISNLRSELKKLEDREKKLKKKQKEIILRYKIGSQPRYFCELLAEIGHQRLLLRIKGWMPLYESIKKIIRALARHHNYDLRLIRYCTVEELINLSKGKLISKELLRSRKKVFLLIYEYPKTKIYSGNDANRKFQELVPFEDYRKIKEVRGTIAMKGKIIGKVLIFQWGDDIKGKIRKIKKGEKIILVTGQTRPQLMPLIVKCSAIITDEGGITSHSAIVSRELGIPCIVGTRIGTRVFKDNDFVEVDANNGVVKIIN